MSKTDHQPTDAAHESVHEQYILDVRIVTVESSADDDPRYRFEAPQHQGVEFTDPEMAELYADVYFCVNGFAEEGTGERGVPPVIIGAGRAVLASYMLTQPHTDFEWVASFFGMKPHRVKQYVSNVQDRADEIRDGAAEQGVQ
ncbi:hypothetical protein [Salinigranum salinum]|uniref:hypothetical protein n=1 Tax=Salinigranum salinum TaxID=1364937 RepID=UPI0012604EDD|nr:hypothetical protein [Salinigranum salinum]